MAFRTIVQLIECLVLQKANLPTYQTQVGATAADITRVGEHLAILEALVEHCDLYDANKKTAFGVKDQVFRGLENEPVAAVPTTPAFVPPFPLVSGILSITNSANRRFREGPGYDNEIGIALGIGTKAEVPIPDGDVKPTIEVFAAQSDGMFSVVVGNRQSSDMWVVEILRKGAVEWQPAGTFTGKSADVTISLTTPGVPEQIQIRVRLRKNNADYGLVSDAATLTVNP